ncbi:MAG: DNA-directed DNA polymerase III PolC [Saprospiraceae bacterium]|jgi:DNA-directed DNA polymerase III PolC
MYLNCHTHYSFRYGTISEEALLQLVAKNDIRKIALTDINNTSACLNFIRLAPKYGIKPIIGIDFRNGITQEYIGLAKNNEGFKELNDFLSYHSHEKLELPEEAPELPNAFIIYPFSKIAKKTNYKIRSNEYIGIKLSEINKLKFSNLPYGEEKFVLLHPISFLNKTGFNTHRLLRAIGQNTLLSKLPTDEQAPPDEIMLPPDELRERLNQHPRILFNTDQLLEQCEVTFDFSPERKPQNIKTYTNSFEDDFLLLKQECAKGLIYRYKKVTPAIQSRLKKEMDLIEKMGYVAFFLTNWDIVQYAKNRGYYHVGRGSGANSIVAYLLGITDVDPIDLDLYFERFMNLYRANPPDFDIDFSWRDREDMTQYIFDRFGQNNQVALLATYNTFQYNGAVREMGKVFGLPKHEIDNLSKGRVNVSSLDQLSQLTLRYASQIQGMPNHLSVHSAGILISEKPIHYFTATDLPPKGFATTQFDMIISEDVGLYKYDILGQRGLGKIKDAIALVRENQPEAELVDIHDVKPLLQDPNINDLIRKAKCIGCFYVESPAMRMLLRKLEVDNYLGLVAASSIIRPGVAKSGMMREYILRHKNPARRKQAHPIMWEIMPETYGVMVYQEDVIKVAHIFAGLDLGEADVLRRGMSGKYRSREEFQKVKEKFISNCRERGEPDKTIQEIWNQTESFAGYAFAKGHSASYAVESYQSLYLKAYFPIEYMVAVLNNGGGFYRPELYIHEARICGAIIHPPCVNHSEYETTLEGKNIYLGFHLLNNLDRETSDKIVQSRHAHGNYKTLDDFMARNFLGIEQLDILVRIDAFRTTGVNRRSLLWKAYYQSHHQKPAVEQQQLFKPRSKNFKFPKFEITALEDAFDQIELLGFPLSSPFLLLEQENTNKLTSKDLSQLINKKVSIVGYLITAKRTKTSNGKQMFFGTFLDIEGDWIDTVHFPPVAAQFPFRGKGIYKVIGKVVEEFGFQTIEVASMERLPYITDPRYTL